MNPVLRCDSVAPHLVQRWDTISLAASKYQPTPQGGIRAPARFARSGVLEYDLPDGSKQREWIPPEELFEPTSMAMLHDAPITIQHPDGGKVDAGSYRTVNV